MNDRGPASAPRETAARSCPRCGDPASERANYAVLLNPWTWLFDSPLHAPHYCPDCRGGLALAGIVFAVVAVAAVVFVAILLW